MFKKGDGVMFYKDEYTNRNHMTVSEMRDCLENGTILTVIRVNGNCAEAAASGDPHGFNYDARDLMLANAKMSNKEIVSRLQGGLLENLVEEFGNMEVDSLSYHLKFSPEYLTVGCQQIDKKDAVEIANRILMIYGEV